MRRAATCSSRSTRPRSRGSDSDSGWRSRTTSSAASAGRCAPRQARDWPARRSSSACVRSLSGRRPMSDPAVVLFVEDDPSVRFGSAQALELAGRTVRAFASAEEALPAVTPGFRGVLVTDVRLSGIDGLALLERVKRIDADLPVIVVTGHGDVSMAVQAMRSGAYDFIEKPFSADRLNVAIGRALETRRLTLEVNSLRSQLSGLESIEAKLIGR